MSVSSAETLLPPAQPLALPAHRAAAARLRLLAPLAWPALALALLAVVQLLFTPGFFQIKIAMAALRLAHRHPQSRHAGAAAVAGNDTGHRHRRHRSVGRRGDGAGRRGGRLPDRAAGGFAASRARRARLAAAGHPGGAWLSRWWRGCSTAFWLRCFRLQPIVATLILMVAGRGVAQLVTNGQIPTFQHPALSSSAPASVLALPFPLLIAVARCILMILR